MKLPGVETKPIPRGVFQDHTGHNPHHWNILWTAEDLFERYAMRGESRLPLILFNKGVITAEEFIEAVGLHNIVVVED